MCTSPLKIKNHGVYYQGFSQPSAYNVPCNKCLECRSCNMHEWQTRLSYEINSLYKRGGVAVFLTFTYDNEHLPLFSLLGQQQSCFDRKGVLTFLNRLKVKVYRAFGKGSYKYFFTSEYGKNTKRPHYHALFFLEPGVNYVQFTELCRETWNYGFMFPKYSKTRGIYVGNDGKPSQVTIKSLAGGAKYVSKYITKDMSFYDLPLVLQYIDNKDCDKNVLPKHWQSKNLGSVLVDDIQAHRYDETFIDVALTQGVVNPLDGKLHPLPRYVINKLMYKNVFAGRYNADDKPLYDRELTAFGRKYLSHKIGIKLSKTCGDLYSFMSNLSDYDDYIKQFHLERLYDFQKQFTNEVSDCKPLANYMLVYRYYPVRELLYWYRAEYGDAAFFGDFETAKNLYVLSKDTSYFRSRKYDDLMLDDLPSYDRCISDVFRVYEFVTSSFNKIMFVIRDCQQQHYKRLNDAVNKMRLYFNAFPNNLC